MKVSVVMSTIDSRVVLLERALWCYTQQTYKPIEIVIVADRPQNIETKELVEEYQINYGLDSKYFEVGGLPGWRNGYGQNKGISESMGDIIVVTHPEVMMEPDNIQAILDRLNDEDNVCVMLMWVWLTAHVNDWLKTHNEWRENMALMRDIITDSDYRWNLSDPPHGPGRLDQHVASVLGTIRVAPGTSPTFWQSMAMTRKTWLRIGGFTLMNTWGSSDGDLQARKNILGIPTRIVRALSYHQWHPPGPVKNEFEVFEYKTPRDAIRELKWE